VPDRERYGAGEEFKVALRQSYSAETDIPDALREHYVEAEGQWKIQTDPPIEDVSGLKNVLNQERTLKREAERVLSEMKIKFEGIDPDEVAKMRDRIKGLDDADVYDKQGIEALVLRRTESMKTEHERQMNARTRENEQLKAAVADYEQRWTQDRIKTALLQAASNAGVYDKAMDDFVTRGLAVFNGLDEQGNPVSKLPSGEVRYGKDGINALQPDEWGLSLKPIAPHLWPPSSGGGAPQYHSGNGQGVDYSQIKDPAARLTAFRAAEAARANRP
jgi:hypothetical protein